MNTNKLKLPNRITMELGEIIDKYEINTNLRIAHFLSQIHHESGGFKSVYENLNYTANRLRSVFPKYFKSTEDAKLYQLQPEKIANRVYANRMGNGNEQSGDGFKFRGRSYIQLTGKNNYIQFMSSVHDDVIKNPDLVAEKYPLTTAAWFWNNKKLNFLAEQGPSSEIVTKITKIINGGANGLEHRISLFNYYYKELTNNDLEK